MRQPKTKAWWEEEAAYIERQSLLPFNSRMGSFESYCHMQMKFAEADGCAEEAARIYQAFRDTVEEE